MRRPGHQRRLLHPAARRAVIWCGIMVAAWAFVGLVAVVVWAVL
jgi:hypothetical protein